MKLKYYLRGMGIGIILTAIVMGFALGGRKATISDAEVIERAKALGMVDANSGVLSPGTNGENRNETEFTSDSALAETGEKISEEVNEGVSSASESVSELDKKTPETEDADSETTDSKTKTSDEAASKEILETDVSILKKTEEKIDNQEVTKKQDVAASQNENQVSDTSNNKEQSKTQDVAQTTGQSNKEVTQTAEQSKNQETASEKDNNKTETETNKQESSVTSNDNASAQDASSQESTANTKPAVSGRSITIPGGMSSDSVAALLYNEGIIDNAVSFNRYLIDRNMDRYIRSGTKTIPEGSSYEEVANIICK